MALSPISHLETSHETPEMQTQHFSRRGCGASVGVLAPTPSGDWQHCQLTGFKQHDYLHFSRSAMCCCKFAVAQIRASASHWPRAGGLHPQGNSDSQGKFRCVGLWEQTSCSLWLVAKLFPTSEKPAFAGSWPVFLPAGTAGYSPHTRPSSPSRVYVIR